MCKEPIMPASLPGSNDLDNAGNPNEGRFVTFDPLSGPKGAPLDALMSNYTSGGAFVANPGGLSTGGLSTGIGISCQTIININDSADPATAPGAIFEAGFTDNNTPGKQELTYDAGGPPPVVATDEFDSTMMYIGGGRMEANPDIATQPERPFIPDPYTAGIAICGAGNGGSRDSGANTGFAMKMVTATGAVANGAAVEAGYVNRSGTALVTGDSVFGSAAVALAAAS